MSNNDEYIEYPLEYQGHPVYGVEYFITVYSNHKPLRFNIDSGAVTNLISNPSLKGCKYDNTGKQVESRGLIGGVNTRIVYMYFAMEDIDLETADIEDKFYLPFTVLNKKDNFLFDSTEYDGLLGGTFLQFCDVNFREGYIRVYKNRSGGRVFNALLRKSRNPFDNMDIDD